jgi:hypothetical protein
VSEHDDRLIEEIAAELRRPSSASVAAKARIMAIVRADAAAARARAPRRWAWLTAPRTVRISPLAGLAAAAGVAALVVMARVAPHPTVRRDARTAAAAAPVVAAAPVARLTASGAPEVVQFVLVAPKATRVTLVGDFNGWDARATPLHEDLARGVWTATVRLAAGRHVYAFVVDDRKWLADPTAPRAPDNDFGSPNSVIMVGEPST